MNRSGLILARGWAGPGRRLLHGRPPQLRVADPEVMRYLVVDGLPHLVGKGGVIREVTDQGLPVDGDLIGRHEVVAAGAVARAPVWQRHALVEAVQRPAAARSDALVAGGPAGKHELDVREAVGVGPRQLGQGRLQEASDALGRSQQPDSERGTSMVMKDS